MSGFVCVICVFWDMLFLGYGESGSFCCGWRCVGGFAFIQFRFPDIAWDSELGNVVILY